MISTKLYFFVILTCCPWCCGSTWSTNGTQDSCHEDRGELFPCSSTWTGNIILMVFYGAVIGFGAKCISDGAEMLLDVGLPPIIIGGVVLPIMGAIPDSAIIVASSMGDDPQNKLSVGMGTLAGSTVMLLTVAWGASAVVARCDIGEDGVSIDGKCENGFSVTKQGVTVLPEIKSGIVAMLVTSLLYLVVQSSDWYWGATKVGNQPEYVSQAALATMIMCFIALFTYTMYYILDVKRNERLQQLRREELMKRKVLHTILWLARKETFKPASSSADDDDVPCTEALNIAAIARKYFKIWHTQKGVRRLKEQLSGSSEQEREPLLKDEKATYSKELGTAIVDVKTISSEEEEEEGKVMTFLRCLLLLVAGVTLVTIFADPMCQVLIGLTDDRNKSYIPIPSFYVSFVVTPFCSNASELVSSLIFASRKTRKNSTLTYSQLFGAATMNNTLCLGIFMGLVYFKDLEWIYGAEVVSIVAVQWIVGLISWNKTYKVWMCIPVGFTYFACIAAVYLLEYEAGWH